MKKEAFYSDQVIGTIDLHSLKKNLHGEFHNDVLEETEKCAAIHQYLESQLQTYRQAVKAETDADFVDLDPSVTVELSQKTDARDKVQTGFKSGARAMMEMDDAEVREAANVLFELTHKHGLHTDMNEDAQTDAIRDFVADVRTNHESLLALTGLTVLFNKLDALNEEVCALRKEYFTELAEKKREVFAKARKATDEAYKDLIHGVDAYSYVYGSEPFAQFIAFLNSLIVYYRRVHLKEKIYTAGEGGSTGSGSDVDSDVDGEGGSGEGSESTPSSPSTPNEPTNPGAGSSSEQEYTVTYYGDNGEVITTQRYQVGQTIVPPAPPAGFEWGYLPTVMPARDLNIYPIDPETGA